MTSITNSPRQYRIEASGRILAGKNLNLVEIKLTDEEKQAFKLRDELVQLDLAAAQKDLEEVRKNPDKVFGQVIVEGKVFATVYDSGVAETMRDVSMPNDGHGVSLANARLDAIAKSVHGVVIRSDFLPTLGTLSGRGNETYHSALEAAQRRVSEILESRDLLRQQGGS